MADTEEHRFRILRAVGEGGYAEARALLQSPNKEGALIGLETLNTGLPPMFKLEDTGQEVKFTNPVASPDLFKLHVNNLELEWKVQLLERRIRPPGKPREGPNVKTRRNGAPVNQPEDPQVPLHARKRPIFRG